MSKDVASSKLRTVASYVCLSKPVDLDIPSPLITSSHLLAASTWAKLGMSCCKQPNAVSHWLTAYKFLKVHGSSFLGSASCGTLLRMESDWAARVPSWKAHMQVTPTSPVLPELFPTKHRGRCPKGKPRSPITNSQRGNSWWSWNWVCYHHWPWCSLSWPWWRRCWVSQPHFWKP